MSLHINQRTTSNFSDWRRVSRSEGEPIPFPIHVRTDRRKPSWQENVLLVFCASALVWLVVFTIWCLVAGGMWWPL
ncbi:MAG: hypothetical protein KGL39_47585 [Patescibacteria group bacterium]|nr:hypothetical protein [Patescibacteria group bacterium]